MLVHQSIISLLEENSITFKTLNHPPTYTSEESAAYRGEPLQIGAKAIVYKIEKAFYLFVMPADRKMDTKKVKAYFKENDRKAKKSRFASADELLEMTGLVPGSVPPFGQPILPFELFIDEGILDNDKVAFNAGSLTDSVIMSRSDYVKVANGTLFDFTVQATSDT